MRINNFIKSHSNLFPYILFLLTAYYLLPTVLSAQAGWTPDMRLTYRQGTGWYPRAACCGDTIHLVWWQHYAHDEIFYKRSTDAGITWEYDTILSKEDDTTGYSPCIAVYDNNIHIIWDESYTYYNAICYRRSTNGGTTWGGIQKIVKDTYNGLGHSWICVAKNKLFVTAIKTGTEGRLIFTKSTDNGATWTDSISISSAVQINRILNPKDDSLFLVVVAEDGPVEISSTHSHDGGTSWSNSIYISDYDTICSFFPAATIDKYGGIHAVWSDYKYTAYPWTGDIFYRTSPDSGATWRMIDSLTVYHRVVDSDILAEDNNLHLVWDDERNGPNTNFEIYYRLSTDLGLTWQSEVRLTDADSNSTNPSLATDGNYLHLFWTDDRDTNYNSFGAIYYKRKNWLGIKDQETINDDRSGLVLSCPTIVKGSFPVQYDLGINKSGIITLIDLAGRYVDLIIVDASRKEIYMNINKEVANGMYFLMLKAGIRHRIEKVVVIR
jgi:hypothetical protein